MTKHTKLDLIKKVIFLTKSKVSRIVNTRIKEFKEFRCKSNNEWFKELCFCILTANFNAERAIKIHTMINDGFLNFDKPELIKALKHYGYRYPKTRAEYIVKSRKYKDSIKDIITSFDDEHCAREWLVNNIKGLGLKESSHFLRNVGYDNLAIIDFHIIDLLLRYKIIPDRPYRLSRRLYLEIEQTLGQLAHKLNLTLAELDLYLWYIETNKILK